MLVLWQAYENGGMHFINLLWPADITILRITPYVNWHSLYIVNIISTIIIDPDTQLLISCKKLNIW